MQKTLFAEPVQISVDEGHVRYLSGETGNFTLRWLCPSCNEATAELVKSEEQIDDASTSIQDDPLCYKCRKQR